jgi:ubiquinone/menaquinone biosynthesis C-methylase UbiE
MAQKPNYNLFSTIAENYDRLQPLRIEMYQLYHELALDFVPFEVQDEFRMLELGCGTGTFLSSVLEKYPKAHCLAFDYSDEMLKHAAQKVSKHLDRVEFHQRDLNDGLPAGIGLFQFASSFSTIHHLADENKARLFKQIYDVLADGGWFFLIDAMSVRFDDDVFRIGKRRQRLRLEERFRGAGVDLREAERVEAMVSRVGEDSPEGDRISRFSSHLEWLREAGFRSVDHIWHFWMEHFIISRK